MKNESNPRTYFIFKAVDPLSESYTLQEDQTTDGQVIKAGELLV